LNAGTTFGKKLEAFVQKGGDTLATEINHYDSFLEGNIDWNDNDTNPTIFNNPVMKVKPLMRFQRDWSTVCYFAVAATAIFYSCCPVDMPREQAMKEYALNINRFMRMYFTDDAIFANIYMGEGGHPKRTTLHLLEKWNPTRAEEDMVRDVDLSITEDVSSAYALITNCLRKYGALVVHRLPMFPELQLGRTQEYHGEWDTKDKFSEDDNSYGINHAVLIVGASLTKTAHMGGIALLVQNSVATLPFFILGYDLLRSMEVEMLFVVGRDLEFSTGENSTQQSYSDGNTLYSGASPASIPNPEALCFDCDASPASIPNPEALCFDCDVAAPTTA
jgi:hypothetical protein